MPDLQAERDKTKAGLAETSAELSQAKQQHEVQLQLAAAEATNRLAALRDEHARCILLLEQQYIKGTLISI